MQEIILIKLGEMVLKGLNRKVFDNVLLKDIRSRLKPVGKFDVQYSQSTIYVIPQDESADIDAAEERISKTFGIITYVRACMVRKDLSSICEAAAEYLSEELRSAPNFKVESKRADKSFPLSSPELSCEVGSYLCEKYPDLTVDVHNPALTVRVEIRDFGAYVHGEAKSGAGGFPIGTGGRAAILISGGIDSPVAAWMMARRGAALVAVHFASPPYTSERAEDKVVRLLTKVAEYSGRMLMFTVRFTHIQEEILKNCPEELFTLIMRRFMVRVAERVAQKEDCEALITGESLGQVASQTMRAIACTDAVSTMPIFRPLIGNDKSEIVEFSRKIGTFQISIEPYEDCCTVFTPKHPRTKPPLSVIEEAEAKLDVEGLVAECMQNLKVTPIHREERI